MSIDTSLLAYGGGSAITTGAPVSVDITPPPGVSVDFWNQVLDAVRQQEGNSNYGVSYLPGTGTPEDIGRSAASQTLSYWYQKLGGLIPALAKYGACGTSSLPGQPCGTDYAAAVAGILAGPGSSAAPSTAGGVSQFHLPALPSGWQKPTIILLALAVIAFAIAGIRGKRPSQIQVVPA